MLMYITYTVHITYNTLNSTSNKGVKRLRRIEESIHDSFPCSGYPGYMVSLNDSRCWRKCDICSLSNSSVMFHCGVAAVQSFGYFVSADSIF